MIGYHLLPREQRPSSGRLTYRQQSRNPSTRPGSLDRETYPAAQHPTLATQENLRDRLREEKVGGPFDRICLPVEITES